MRRAEIMEEAENHSAEDCAFIYGSKKDDGLPGSLIIAGDGYTLCQMVAMAVIRLSKLTRTTEGDVLGIVGELVGEQSGETAIQAGEPDPRPTEKHKLAEECARLEAELKAEAIKREAAQRSAELSASVAKDLRRQLDEQRRKATADLQKAQKEIRRLDHENERLNEIIRLNKGDG